jgi:hypothetical protein
MRGVLRRWKCDAMCSLRVDMVCIFGGDTTALQAGAFGPAFLLARPFVLGICDVSISHSRSGRPCLKTLQVHGEFCGFRHCKGWSCVGIIVIVVTFVMTVSIRRRLLSGPVSRGSMFW